MILNIGDSNKVITADTVGYGNSNVGAALNSLESKDVSLTNSVSGLNNSVSGLTTKSNTMNSAISTLENELTANGKRIYLDYKDGKYGYNTSATRGADTFSPFKSGEITEYTNLTTVLSVSGNNLPTITGSGYIILRRIGKVSSSNILNVFIDNNTEPFTVYIESANYGVKGDFLRFYFQKSIKFTGGSSNETYFYQTLLADKLVSGNYKITQGKTSGTNYITITGKGRILISPLYTNPAMLYSIDGGSEQTLDFYGYQYMEIMFNKSFKFKTSYESYPLCYIAYTEL